MVGTSDCVDVGVKGEEVAHRFEISSLTSYAERCANCSFCHTVDVDAIVDSGFDSFVVASFRCLVKSSAAILKGVLLSAVIHHRERMGWITLS